MKTRNILVIGAAAWCILFASGISYAWFTSEAYTEPIIAEIGNMQILLDGTPDLSDNIFPAEDGKTIDYEITNASNGEVVAQFKAGAVTAYQMPASFMDSEGYVKKEYRKFLEDLQPEQKVDYQFSGFVESKVPTSEVRSGIMGEWTLSDGSEYLGKDVDGNHYFRLLKGGNAKAVFEIALTADADNRYQYALLRLGEAAALATQSNTSAIVDIFNGLDIKSLEK